jgi:hypothetical protein
MKLLSKNQIDDQERSYKNKQITYGRKLSTAIEEEKEKLQAIRSQIAAEREKFEKEKIAFELKYQEAVRDKSIEIKAFEKRKKEALKPLTNKENELKRKESEIAERERKIAQTLKQIENEGKEVERQKVEADKTVSKGERILRQAEEREQDTKQKRKSVEITLQRA